MLSQKMKVIHANIDHLKGITDLRQENAEYHSSILEKKLNPSSRNNLEDLTKDILKWDKWVILLAVDKDKIIAYIIWIIRDEHPVFETWKIWFIDDIYVHPKKQNQNIWSKLVDHLYGYFQKNNIHYVQLNVYWDNAIWMNFWEKLGFNEERKTMYTNI